MTSKANETKDKLRLPAIKPPALTDYLSTGCYVLDKELSGNPRGGFIKGGYFWLVGDSESGKTFLSLTCYAEAAKNEHFAKHRLIFDPADRGALMEAKKFFGTVAAGRIEPPCYRNGVAWHSERVEDFYFNVHEAAGRMQNRPFLYTLDDADSLTSEAEKKKFIANKGKALKTAAKEEAGETTTAEEAKLKGDYGDGKAGKNSRMIRIIRNSLEKSGSILIIISQTRDNVTNPYNPKTASGGHALKFYATAQLWSSVKGKIWAPGLSPTAKPIQTGIYCKVEIRKNRLTGRHGEVIIPIYNSYGIDDVGASILWLVDCGYWSGSRLDDKVGIKEVESPEFKFKGRAEKLAQFIQGDKTREYVLRTIVDKAHKAIQEVTALQRKPRYT